MPIDQTCFSCKCKQINSCAFLTRIFVNITREWYAFFNSYLLTIYSNTTILRYSIVCIFIDFWQLYIRSMYSLFLKFVKILIYFFSFESDLYQILFDFCKFPSHSRINIFFCSNVIIYFWCTNVWIYFFQYCGSNFFVLASLSLSKEYTEYSFLCFFLLL